MSAFNALNVAMLNKLAVGTSLTALLSSGSTSLYYQLAPDEAGLDYVVWNWQGGGDDNTSPHRTKNLVLYARGYSSVGPKRAGEIDAQLDALLHKQSLSVTGWNNFWLMRERDVSQVEIDTANVKTWMAGGMYRTRIEQT